MRIAVVGAGGVGGGFGAALESVSRLPDGQITDVAVQPLSQKDLCFLLTQIIS